jgi:hypothetical protein
VWYTIECRNERDASRPHLMSMVFRDKESALANACALLKAGFSVSQVEGPDGFKMMPNSLAAYAQSQQRKRSAV